MTGSPLFRLLLLLAGLVVLAIPAWKLTGRTSPVPAAPAAPEPQVPSPQPVHLQFTSPRPPDSIFVEALGHQVASLAGPDGPWSVEIPLELPAEGLDLVVRATWSGTAPANALRVQARTGAHDLMDTTLWGDPNLEDVVTLPGGESP